jgi:hypothetical protein
MPKAEADNYGLSKHTYTTAANVWAQAKLAELDDLASALWLAVDAATPILRVNHSVEARALRGIARALETDLSDLADELRQVTDPGWHVLVPQPRAAPQYA